MKKIIAILAVLLTACARQGIVIEKTYEGCPEFNDYYLIEYEDGNIHEIEADDLEVGDRVETTFIGGYPIRTLYKD